MAIQSGYQKGHGICFYIRWNTFKIELKMIIALYLVRTTGKGVPESSIIKAINILWVGIHINILRTFYDHLSDYNLSYV